MTTPKPHIYKILGLWAADKVRGKWDVNTSIVGFDMRTLARRWYALK